MFQESYRTLPPRRSKAAAPPPAESPAPDRVAALRHGLLAWYDRHRRDLPWRAAPGLAVDPYHVLVSEAMLQQTQVATVIPYFHRFLKAFPSVEALAAADEQQVLRLWQGLGYYRRARNLHAAAKAILERFGGRVPATVKELLTLPGVGRYTAGAVASIAYGTRAPILDGNVIRVLARLFRLTEPVAETPTKARLWDLAATLVPDDRPGDFNQAMMELGATVCIPREPRCLLCPVAEGCEARKAGVQGDLPVVAARKPTPTITHTVLALERAGRFLFQQRPATGLWASLWQMPTRENEGDADPTVDELAAWAVAELGLRFEAATQATSFTHQTTHRTVRFAVWKAKVTAGRVKRGRGVWRRLDDVDDLPLAKPQQRAVSAVSK